MTNYIVNTLNELDDLELNAGMQAVLSVARMVVAGKADKDDLGRVLEAHDCISQAEQLMRSVHSSLHIENEVSIS